MHIRTDYWRFTLFTALGLCPNACSQADASATVAEVVTEDDDDSRISECGRSTPVNSEGDAGASGFSRCSNGLEHRPSNRVTCTSELPRELSEEAAELAAQRPADACKSDAECTDKPHGFCDGKVVMSIGPVRYSCTYGCLTDADCDDGHLCSCGSPVGRCVPSDCTQDSDCEEGMLCAEAFIAAPDCGGTVAYHCQRPDDECAVSDDCPSPDEMACNFDGTRRVCADRSPPCGRPFLVEGTALVAPLGSFPFGQSKGCVELGPLDKASAATRETLGQYWANIGLMEHASIAAFARFALQLMHVGAPLSLLAAAQQAMLDETAHAKACFGIASQLLGRSVGPGKLPTDHALTETSLEDIVRLTVREGCIGETIAAIEAAEAAALACDPHIRAVLRQIQKDELTHAELAWCFVQWALSHEASANPTADRSLRDAVRQEIAAAMAELEAPSEVVAPETERLGARYGVVPAATRTAIRRSALAGVVAPCAAELLRGFEVRAEVTMLAARA